MVSLRAGIRMLVDAPFLRAETQRWARRPHMFAIRAGVLFALLLVLLAVYLLEVRAGSATFTLKRRAALAERYVLAILIMQNVAVLALAPLLVIHSLREEENRRTIELLLASQLTEREILWGKCFAHVALLASLVLACLPVVLLLQSWSGVAGVVVAVNYLNTAANLVTICGLCFLCSLQAHGTSSFLGSLWHRVYWFFLPALMLRLNYAALVFAIPPSATLSSHMAELGVLVLLHASCWLILLWSSKRVFAEWRKRIAEGTFIDKAAAPVGTNFPRTEVGDDALLWKETQYRKNGLPAEALIVPPFLVVCALAYANGGNWFAGRNPEFAEYGQHAFRAMIVLTCGYYCLSITLCLTTSFAVERERGTLDNLLVLPLARFELLRAVTRGAFLRRQGWVPVFAGVVLLGLALGALHPLSFFLVIFGAGVHALFWPLLGLFISLVSATQQGALIRLSVVLALFLGVPTLLSWTRALGTDSFWIDILDWGVNPLGVWTHACFDWKDAAPSLTQLAAFIMGVGCLGLSTLMVWHLCRRRLEAA